MDGFYPYGVSTTLPHHLEELGHVLAPPVTVVKYDSSEELIWTGTETGSLTLSHAPSLERHCASRTGIRDSRCGPNRGWCDICEW